MKSAPQESQLSLTMTMVVDEGKEEKNASCGCNWTWVPCVMKPTSIWLRHSGTVEAVWIWRELHGPAKLDRKNMHPSVQRQQWLNAKLSLCEIKWWRAKSKSLRSKSKLHGSQSSSPDANYRIPHEKALHSTIVVVRRIDGGLHDFLLLYSVHKNAVVIVQMGSVHRKILWAITDIRGKKTTSRK